MLKQFRKTVSPMVAQVASLEETDVCERLEIPKKGGQGHLAFPVFFMAAQQKKAPPQLAKEIATQLSEQKIEGVDKIEAAGGFVNFWFTPQCLQSVLLENFKNLQTLGHSDEYKNQLLVIDYSSPNVAKPMGVGHLRSTIIGQALANLARTQGFKVIGVNHLGDWGVQFGRLAWGYKKWGAEYDFEKTPFESLYEIYVRFHQEAEKDSTLLEEGSLLFKKLESGDVELKALWQKFIDITITENDVLYDFMKIKHDMVLGESFYNDQLSAVEEALTESGLLVKDQAAMVVRLDETDMPPCLIRKQDGASLYATRDLATAIYRFEKQNADMVIVETDLGQSLHFQQVKAVLKKQGYSWVDRMHHVGHGLYKFKDQKMSTRAGNVIFLKDVLDESVKKVAEVIAKKNPDLKNKSKIARQVGVGALFFNDLVNDRVKDIIIDWDRILDFSGDSGPYVQYCQVRCQSLLRKYEEEISFELTQGWETSQEQDLALKLLEFQEVLSTSYAALKPHILANYLLMVCKSFSRFYQDCRILDEALEVKRARMTLVACTGHILQKGLSVLHIESPAEM